MNNKIVVIDDEEINLDIAEGILTSFDDLKDYEILTFSDPMEALDYCKKNSDIAIILLDQYMPELTGTEFVDKYHANVSSTDRASIIMISSEKSSEVISSAIMKGIDDYFNKPFDADIMYARIRNSIEKKNLRHEIEEERMLSQILLRTLIHDISNPLAIVMMKLRRHAQHDSDDRFKDIETSLQPISNILTSIKQIEAVKAKKCSLEMEEISVIDLTKRLRENNSSLLTDKGIKLNFNGISDNDLKIVSNQNILIYQILSNLLTNSIKFSEAGSEIDIIVEEVEEGVAIHIRDYGVGIPEDILKDLFKWNSKTNRAGTNNEKGTGFGMPIVDKFVHDLGHSIHVDSWTTNSDGHRRGTDIKIIFHNK